jgi:hypothetical protein
MTWELTITIESRNKKGRAISDLVLQALFSSILFSITQALHKNYECDKP